MSAQPAADWLPHPGKTAAEKAEPPAAPQWPAPLKRAAFYGIAGEVIETLLPHSESDPAALLAQLLIAIANLVGRAPYFAAQGTCHYPNLFAVLVGVTSHARKGSSLDQVLLPLRRFDEHWSENRVRSGLSSGEGLICRVRDPFEEQKPIRQKGRVTGYETVVRDPGETDKRLLLIEPEFARVLQVIERETNTLSCVIRSLGHRESGEWHAEFASAGHKRAYLSARSCHES